MARDAKTYQEYFQKLLPPGQAFNAENQERLAAILYVFGVAFSDLDLRVDTLLREALPEATQELINEWEIEVGLPDQCIGMPDTLKQRRDLIVQRIVSRGGQSPSFYIEIAKLMGYDITITEHRPFIAGRSRCGTRISGVPTDIEKIRFHWTVNVAEARTNNFRTGISRCGESLGSFSNASDLQCVFNRIKPSHTVMHFNYEGVI